LIRTLEVASKEDGAEEGFEVEEDGISRFLNRDNSAIEG